MDTIYRERANARWEYWTYAEGRKYAISAATANKWLAQGTAKLVEVM